MTEATVRSHKLSLGVRLPSAESPRCHGFARLIQFLLSCVRSIAPNIDMPVISVAWTYTGLNPGDLETRLTTPFEKGFTTLDRFTAVFSYGEPPFYAQIARDGGRLNLRRVSGPVFDSGFRSRETDALSATLTLDDAKPLFLEFQKAGVAFHQTLRTEPWGARTFIVQDLDGNLIAFAGG
jgi:hypothetical protein